ncbi:hypothetical protein CsSME_00040938 [Camellia sinensis var. sinensis]
MVFSSVPVYLDHPNWHHQLQQQNYHHRQGGVTENSQLQPPPPSPPPQLSGGIGGSDGGSVRPGSMVDRARIAKIPLPEAGLNCPRCDSTNTKFCYFNNYSLSQPRHFCKTCRRYWTRGGALRSVPVGGGCRRSKKIKNNSSSKSQVTSENRTRPNSKSTSASPSSCSTDNNISGGSGHFPPPPQFPFMAALQNLAQYGGGGGGNNIGSNIAEFQAQMAAAGGGGGVEQWRLPFLGGLETPTNLLYPSYQSQGFEAQSSGISTQIGSVKMEENMNNQGLNFPRQFMGMTENYQYCGGIGNTWNEFAGVNSSSTSHLL